MAQKSKKWILFLSISLLFAVLLDVCFLKTSIYRSFDYISNAVYVDDSEIVVSDDGSYVEIAKLKDGCLEESMEFPKIKEGIYDMPLQLIQDGSDLYLCNFYNKLNTTDNNYEIYQLDFKGKQLEKKFSYSERELEEVLTSYHLYLYSSFCSVSGGVIYVTVSAYGQNNIYALLTFVKGDEGWIEMDQTFTDSAYLYADRFSKDVSSQYLCLDKTGTVSVKSQNGIEKFQGTYSAIYKTFDGTYIGKSALRDGFDVLNPYKMSAAPCTTLDEQIRSGKITASSIRNINVCDERMTIAGYENGSGMLLELDGDQASVHGGFRTMGTVKCVFLCLGFSAAAFVLTGGLWLLVSQLKKRGSVAVRLSVYLLPLILAVDVVMFVAVSTIYYVKEEHAMNQSLILMGKEYAAMEFSADIADFYEYDNPKSSNYVAVEEFHDNFLSILVDNIQRLENEAYADMVAMDVDYIGVDRQNDMLLVIEGEVMGIDAEKALDAVLYQTIKSVISTREPAVCEAYDSYHQKNRCAVVPTYGPQGNVNGAYVILVWEAEVQQSNLEITAEIILYELCLSLLVYLTFVLVTAVSLHPLKKLREKASKLAAGRLAFETREKSFKHLDEISMLSQNFDETARSVQTNLGQIKRLRQNSKAYFSDDVVRLTGRKSISLLNFREHSRREAYVLSVFLPETYGSFTAFHALMAMLTPQLEQYHGVMSETDGCTMTILSEDSKAMNLALQLRRYDNRIRVIFDCCEMEIQVVGYGDDYVISMTHSDTTRQQILTEYLFQTGGSMLVTDRSFDCAHSDTIACCIGKIGSEYVYEVSIDAKDNVRKLSRDFMKRGVDLYFAGDYAQAREQFIFALKQNRDNMAAKYYIDLIDSME